LQLRVYNKNNFVLCYLSNFHQLLENWNWAILENWRMGLPAQYLQYYRKILSSGYYLSLVQRTEQTSVITVQTLVDSLLTLKWRFGVQSELGCHGTNLWKMEIQSDLGNPVTFTLRTPEHSIYRLNLESTFARNGVTWNFQ